ncbi:1-phosphofructokinase family hexose kinase [Streptomyces sp. AJS327]|uniref:1-phosphofructokinase family hexose kinase n=1 Tax=Streptomyces sp. AJS327 TaxID=2545265 RepID=UPI0015E03368|nr:hexose kinase [Streptomyces sp. AJS327]
MILTVTCNPAIDVTYRLPHLEPGDVHRVTEVTRSPGGKGVNVSRVLRLLRRSTLATGLAGPGFTGLLTDRGVDAHFVESLPQTRQTLVVHDDQRVTSLWEPGYVAAPNSENDLTDLVAQRLRDATVLVVSGSLPPGTDPALPTRLAHLGREHAVPVILDLDGEPLLYAARNSAAILTPNRDELGRLLGASGEAVEVVAASRELAAATGAPVVVTLGADGVIASDSETTWQVKPLRALEGNPTGAGDAAVAAIASALTDGRPWPEILTEAVATSAAAVVAPAAGEIDLPTRRAWRHQLHAEPITRLLSER